jgi:enoyl-CoA hydratase/carnithine racemase
MKTARALTGAPSSAADALAVGLVQKVRHHALHVATANRDVHKP